MNAEAAQIREAIGRQQYREALAQWNGYARRLREAAATGCLSTGQMAEARALFEWSRETLLAARAHLRDRCRHLEVSAAYRTRPAAPRREPSITLTA